MANKCKSCGCTCKSDEQDVHLHHEIEVLKEQLVEKETHIVNMETNFLNETNKYPSGELGVLRDELYTCQDKYKRLHEAHRRIQRVNQGLEDKLLKLVDHCETEKNALTKDVATLSQKLAEANYVIKKLTEDNERYKQDVTLAVQFLQCKQSNFVAHKFESLPQELQTQVAGYVTTKKKQDETKVLAEVKSIKVPIPTFPPTAMVYSVPKSPRPERRFEEPEPPSVDIVSAAIMAKILEERERERALAKHCDTCTCAKNLKIVFKETHHSTGSQTDDLNGNFCWKCGESEIVTDTGSRNTADIKSQKVTQTNPTDNLESSVATQTSYNVVKVQPNNFLLNSDSKNNSRTSSSTDINRNASNKLLFDEIITYQNINKKFQKNILSKEKLNLTPLHKSDALEKADLELNIDKHEGDSKDSKGPRFCSMRLQTGTRNILLDNAQNNVAPVLYTRNQTVPTKDKSSTVESFSSNTNGLNSMHSETPAQNQQRVAEWIRSNLENDVDSSDNFRSNSLKFKMIPAEDKVKYAAMEENVKRFLFGETDFLKTVEIGKLKYQSLRETNQASPKEDSKKESCTETDI